MAIIFCDDEGRSLIGDGKKSERFGRVNFSGIAIIFCDDEAIVLGESIFGNSDPILMRDLEGRSFWES
jgi:hypothetical protein